MDNSKALFPKSEKISYPVPRKHRDGRTDRPYFMVPLN